jgi:uncharacterized protein
MSKLFHNHSALRIFGFSALASITVLLAMLLLRGVDAMVVTLILIAVEIAFSFDNAIINAKILGQLSRFWQNFFLTVGMVIAVLGMRVVFPIVIVMLTAHLSWGAVWDLALHHPHTYASELNHAHPSIAAFGGAFLLMLALHFFLDDEREVLWIDRIERRLQSIATVWLPSVLSGVLVVGLAALPPNHHRQETVLAGLVGVLTYLAIHALSVSLGKTQAGRTHIGHKTGMAAVWTFVYLEVLDASFSFDGVIGAFAVTSKVLLIAAGLGVGALWVRSLTIFMVRRGTLSNYIYLEHGAHYTVGVLAALMLLSIFLEVPDVIAGLAGIGLISASVIASRQALNAK